ncbi:choline kinase [Brachyspira hyodysenteriae]|uniref:Choline kinase n=1 Tax=Brachyspira hyodysenteriae ATCC 27164 TaxID=1266923 RepID=A0A3B6VP56_BRAHO|nr:sugar phosphate nucleotidyltransferase [Brachyspira hyodysenteriae]ANN62317.1 choline kinase [Brachyspira hyodysenteriae ATCC 27164]KLI27460.1 choline kinase [Brachyspira hyodysenteriae]KLI36115.1 choline kinase [Brachyspira hyodysenteriae]KLI49716.1 choline kinase [Brachyspira hyodysenteriae]MCZ9924015.1 sugar phosphate nucleotidyltransferase [Brachyspira hyodysenteriae]
MKAIILAAGKGTRLYPFTLKKPKPLFKVNGEALLEKNIAFLHSNNIYDITIVTGYMNESFDYYVDKYNLKKVVSNVYDKKNSSSSLNLVRDILDDSLIINADIYIKENIFKYIKPNVSQIISKQIVKGEEDGYISRDSDDRIIKVIKKSTSGYGDTGMMYLVGDMAKAVSERLPFAKDEEFWEDIVYSLIDDYPLYLTKIPNFIVEIDSAKDAILEGLMTREDIINACDNDDDLLNKLSEVLKY